MSDCVLHRGSYMSAHVLLNILSELRISNDRLAEHFIVFCKEFKSSNKKHREC